MNRQRAEVAARSMRKTVCATQPVRPIALGELCAITLAEKSTLTMCCARVLHTSKTALQPQPISDTVFAKTAEEPCKRSRFVRREPDDTSLKYYVMNKSSLKYI